MTEKKFELLENDTVTVNDKTLYRIKALKKFVCGFGVVEVGDIGGFVEKEENLSHKDNCWVFDHACVYGSSKITDHARIYGHAYICDSKLTDNVEVHGSACITNSIIRGYCYIDKCAKLSNSTLIDNCHISGDAVVNNSILYSSPIDCHAVVDKANLTHVRVSDFAKVLGSFDDYDNQKLELRNLTLFGDVIFDSKGKSVFIAKEGVLDGHVTVEKSEDIQFFSIDIPNSNKLEITYIKPNKTWVINRNRYRVLLKNYNEMMLHLSKNGYSNSLMELVRSLSLYVNNPLL